MALNQIMLQLRNSLSPPVDLKYENVHGQRFRDLNVKMLNKSQFDFWARHDERQTLVRERSAFINRLFNIDIILQ